MGCWFMCSVFTSAFDDHSSPQQSVLIVPNAIVPHTLNYLINPIHPESAAIRIASSTHYPFDERLFKAGRPSSG